MPPTDQRARFPYLFIVTYGRSGSTLLQGILNSIPGYCIRGENQGALNTLYNLFRQAKMARNRFSSIGKAPSDAWYGISEIDLDLLVHEIRTIMHDVYLRAPEGTCCIGYKEIRFAPKMVGDLSDYIAFMEMIFPGSGFIFNVRNIADTAKSDFWTNHEDAVGFLTEFHDRMSKTYTFYTEEKERDNFFWLDYDTYKNSPENLMPLFDFLGEPFDLVEIQSIMAKPHSANNRTLPNA